MPNHTDVLSLSNKRQNVWIVRYGLTKFPLIEYVGPFNSPLDPTEGKDHANAIAGRLRQDVMNSCPVEDTVHVYSSPFTRTTETAHIIASHLPGSAKVRIEEGLTEWQQKSLLVEPNGVVTYPKTRDELFQEFTNVDLTYKSVNPQSNCYPSEDERNGHPGGAAFVEESEEDLFQRCLKTLDGILMEQARNGESFVVVSHAPCDQSMAVYFEGQTLQTSGLGAWPLGGITKFSRSVHPDGSYGPWEMESYGDTQHMPGMYQPGLKAWSLPMLSKPMLGDSDKEGLWSKEISAVATAQ